MVLLDVREITKTFGGLVAVNDMSLTVEPGSITALIGPNGAGKTTLFNCITGLLRPDTGSVTLDGTDLSRLDVHERARSGLGRTFQRLEVFTGMTVFENCLVAAEAAHPGKVFRDIGRLRHRPDRRVVETVTSMLGLVGVDHLGDTLAGELSTGTLRQVELARALCTDPRVLLLDEPASGLDHDETVAFEEVLREIAGSGIGILLVEHDVELVLRVADWIHVMDFGESVMDGPPGVVRGDPRVQAVYLGVDEEHVLDDVVRVP
ncbi:MAG TPA: ABC transporter ATP-binding protein [Nitriliruptorales bacterium]|jgi:branched-chain amino acid transport system ATP-binding protein